MLHCDRKFLASEKRAESQTASFSIKLTFVSLRKELCNMECRLIYKWPRTFARSVCTNLYNSCILSFEVMKLWQGIDSFCFHVLKNNLIKRNSDAVPFILNAIFSCRHSDVTNVCTKLMYPDQINHSALMELLSIFTGHGFAGGCCKC